MTEITAEQKQKIAMFMSKKAPEFSREFEQMCREIGVSEDNTFSLLLTSKIGMLAHQLSWCCDDEEEVLDMSQMIRKDIVDITCQVMTMRKNRDQLTPAA